MKTYRTLFLRDKVTAPPVSGVLRRDQSSHLVQVAAQLLILSRESLDAPLGDTVLVQSGLQLPLHVIVVRLELRQLRQTQGSQQAQAHMFSQSLMWLNVKGKMRNGHCATKHQVQQAMGHVEADGGNGRGTWVSNLLTASASGD